ncbi:unnamed protein product [Rotaria magnacalcarata]
MNEIIKHILNTNDKRLSIQRRYGGGNILLRTSLLMDEALSLIILPLYVIIINLFNKSLLTLLIKLFLYNSRPSICSTKYALRLSLHILLHSLVFYLYSC